MHGSGDFLVLAARWLQRSFECDLERCRLCDCGIAFASFESWVLRAWRDLHVHMHGFQWIGRCEERGRRADRGLSTVSADR